MKIRIGWVVLAVFFLFCASEAAWAVPGKSGTARQKSATVNKSESLGRVDPDKALVYVIRETHLGFGVDTWSFCDDKYIGMNRGRSYFYAHVEPGRHLMWSKAENISPYEMTFERGKTYYFLEDILMGAFSARVRLGPISEDEGKALIDKHEFKMLAPTEAGLRRGETFAAKHYSKALENWEKREKKESGEGARQPARKRNK